MNTAGTIEKLRVSVATYDQVVFSHPENGTSLLALERKATVWEDGSISILAQPFGGGVRILDPSPLTKIIGEIQFDSKSSELEQDFRILIHSNQWDAVKQYCLRHLENPDDPELEAKPDRELMEEFEETLHVKLRSDQYTVQPIGFIIQDGSVPSKNPNAPGRLTKRIYRAFKVEIVDFALCQTMLAVSESISDAELGTIALKDFQNGGKGHANSILTLPLGTVTKSYRSIPPERRYRKIVVENHELDESVLAVLDGIVVPQYQRIIK